MMDFVIIANGNFLPKQIIEEACRNKIIIALDGAADKLYLLGLLPHIILGDFDSIQHPERWGIQKTFSGLCVNDQPYLGWKNIKIVPAKNQDLTDLVKAIRYCDQQGANYITILCAHGGRLDLHEGNMRALRTEYHPFRPIILHTEQQSLRFLKNEEIIVKGEIGDKFGIVAYPHAQFSSSGLKYDVTDYTLEFGFSESICNSLKETHANIVVQGEALLMMPPMLKSQRHTLLAEAT